MSDYRLGPNERFEDIYEERSASYRKIRHYHIAEQAMWDIEPVIEELEGLWPMMPRVESSGYSECPFAEDMYRKKQSLENQISEKLATLRRMLNEIDQEIERCKGNLSRISVDANKLNRPEARSKYADGWGRQEQEYVEAMQMRSCVLGLVARAEEVLTAARGKKFPMPLSPGTPLSHLPASASSYPAPSPGNGVHERVDDMFSLGRL